jgi:indole-3-glycerol phosphate synthase
MSAETHSEHILDRIVGAKLQELERRRAAVPASVLEREISRRPAGQAGRFREALLARRGGDLTNPKPRFAIIAESKKASPSLGVIQQNYDAVANAVAYERAGASAVSVLTDEQFFQGSLDDLRRVKAACSLPALRKDFTLDEYHVLEAAAAGADAILLIVAILDIGRIRRLLTQARALGLDALVEVANRAELNTAIEANSEIIGVNNRDLKTFTVSLNTSCELIDAIPDSVVAVSESGLHSGTALAWLEAAGFDAFLIGEHFLKQPHPGGALAALFRDVD